MFVPDHTRRRRSTRTLITPRTLGRIGHGLPGSWTRRPRPFQAYLKTEDFEKSSAKPSGTLAGRSKSSENSSPAALSNSKFKSTADLMGNPGHRQLS
jgi:hypothetical protein